MITAKQFEPAEQFDALLNEIGEKIAAVTGDLARLEWLRLKTAEQLSTLRAEAERFEIFNESEAADALKINKRMLADLRRDMDIPHCMFGNHPRYTKRHLAEICQILESRPRGMASLKMAA